MLKHTLSVLRLEHLLLLWIWKMLLLTHTAIHVLHRWVIHRSRRWQRHRVVRLEPAGSKSSWWAAEQQRRCCLRHHEVVVQIASEIGNPVVDRAHVMSVIAWDHILSRILHLGILLLLENVWISLILNLKCCSLKSRVMDLRRWMSWLLLLQLHGSCRLLDVGAYWLRLCLECLQRLWALGLLAVMEGLQVLLTRFAIVLVVQIMRRRNLLSSEWGRLLSR